MTNSVSAQRGPEQAVKLDCTVDAGFAEWMAACGGSLAVTTYQAGRLLMVGWNGRQVSFLPRSFERVMGIDVQGPHMALALRTGICLLADAPALAGGYLEPGRYDALYLPRATYHLPDLQVHDLAYCDDALWFVNTRMSCLSRLSLTHSFDVAWTPPFIDTLLPEDRCHLNGLATVDGRPRYVTALARSNTADGWRGGGLVRSGIVMEVPSGDVVCEGLAMPHSPRWHDGALWLLNSGYGELLRLDAQGKAEVVCRLPAYLRGLCFVGSYALVGLCQVREGGPFKEMPVAQRGDTRLCGVAIVDLRRGTSVGFLKLTSGCTEIYDIRFIAGRQRPGVLNVERPESSYALSTPACSVWLTPKAPG